MRTLLLSVLLVVSGACAAQSQRALRDSLALISGLIEAHPQSMPLQLRKASLCIELSQWPQALQAYDRAVEIYDSAGTAAKAAAQASYLAARYYRAYVYNHMLRYDDAERDYHAVLHAVPDHYNALVGLTYNDLDRGRVQAALLTSERLLLQWPDTAATYAVRADVEAKAGAYDAALLDIEQAIALETAAGVPYPLTADDNLAVYRQTAIRLYRAAGRLREAEEQRKVLRQLGIRN